MGSRLVAETAWERYGGDESADGTVTILPRRICGRCCYHAICSCWGAAAGERDGGDESADAAVTMLFAAVGVELLGSETEETNLRTVLLPCYLQLLGRRCWGAIRRRRICGRCCYHAICSCWGAAAGERDGGDESADAAVAMLFAAVGVQLLGSETEETNLRTVLLPCIAMLFAAVGVQLLWSDTEETNLRTVLLPCYLQLLGCSCWGARRRRRICGRAVAMLFAAVGMQLLGSETEGDESADAAVAMLFAAVGVQLLGSDTEETNLRTVLLPCYLQLLGCSCWGAIRRRRICGRCCYHAICSCWGAAAGERDCGDEVADGAVTMRIGDWGRRRLGGDGAADGAWWWRMLLFK